MPIIVQQFHPRLQVTVIKNGGDSAAEIVTSDGRRIQDDLVQVQTDKDIAELAGTFSIRTTAKRDPSGRTWDMLVGPMDYVEIRFQKSINDTASETLIMRGFVDTTQTSIGIGSDGTPEVYCQIQGRDYGKLFQRAIFVVLPKGAPVSGSGLQNFTVPQEFGLSTGMIQTPESYLVDILKTVEGTQSQNGKASGIMSIPVGAPMLDVKVDPMMNQRFSVINQSQSPFTGSVWNAVSFYASQPFFEMFVTDDLFDAPPGAIAAAAAVASAAESIAGSAAANQNPTVHHPAPTLVWRRSPYLNFKGQLAAQDAGLLFPDAPDLPLDQVHSINLSRSDEQQFSYFLTFPSYGGFDTESFWELDGAPVDKGGVAYWDEALTKRFGFAPLEGTLSIVPTKSASTISTQTQQDGIFEEMKPTCIEYSKWLYDVFQANYLYLGGTITCKGDPALRIGRHVTLEDLGIKMYIEGVSHQFVVGVNELSFTSTITVTRGQFPQGQTPYEVVTGNPDLGIDTTSSGPTPPPNLPPPTSTPAGCNWVLPWSGGSFACTQGYGPTSVVEEPALHGYAHYHEGVDVGLPCGTPLLAVANGTVAQIDTNPAVHYGYSIIIRLADGSTVRYGHMSQLPNFNVGDSVTQGQLLGLSGTTGASTGCHTHIEWRDSAGNTMDPTSCIAGGLSTACGHS